MNNRKVFLRLFLCLSFGWGTMTLNAQTVSKTFSNAPLKTVLKEVESQTGLSVVYKTDEVDVNRKVNASFQNASLEEVMALAKANNPISIFATGFSAALRKYSSI